MIYVRLDMIFGQKIRLKNILKIKWDEKISVKKHTIGGLHYW